jgi:CubicO group peptidase (beta-lactamase class C family)
VLETRKTVDRVQALLDELVGSGVEVGLQVAAYREGELVLDTWAGVADEESGRPVDADTLFVMFSATKGVTATAIHMLVERGELDYEAPVARYWPEFGKHGKERVTLRHALAHQAGVPQMPEGATPELMADWDAVCAAIADLTPLWEPGSRTQYHGMTFGWILGEVLRRVDGRTVREFVRQEIAGPIGATDLNIGITAADEGRVARLRAAPGSSTTISADRWNRPEMHQAIIPAAGGLFNARSLARLYAVLAAGGELDGIRLLPRERIETARQQQTRPEDAAEVGMVFGLGYRLGSPVYPEWGLLRALGSDPRVFGHTGAGGSLGFADPERRFAFALTKNLLHPVVEGQASTTRRIVEAVRGALGVAP